MTTLDPIARRILELFDELGRDQLDVHAFSVLAGGSGPGALEPLLEAVDRLTERGWLRAHGSDVYSRTEDGRLELAGPRELTLYGREGCRLCDEARTEILPLLDEFGATLRVVDIDRDPALRDRYNDDVPVLFLGRQEVAKHRVDTAVLRRQLAEARA
jgi:glutaredoxin